MCWPAGDVGAFDVHVRSLLILHESVCIHTLFSLPASLHQDNRGMKGLSRTVPTCTNRNWKRVPSANLTHIAAHRASNSYVAQLRQPECGKSLWFSERTSLRPDSFQIQIHIMNSCSKPKSVLPDASFIPAQVPSCTAACSVLLFLPCRR